MDGSLRAYVREGRLVMDEPTQLPEGTVVDLIPVDDFDDLDDEERAALDDALMEGVAEMMRGEKGIDPAEVLAELRAR